MVGIFLFFSVGKKKKHLLSPLRSSCTGQAAGEPAGEDPPHCSTHWGSHSFHWRAGAWDSLSPLRRDGGQPFPTQQGLGPARLPSPSPRPAWVSPKLPEVFSGAKTRPVWPAHLGEGGGELRVPPPLAGSEVSFPVSKQSRWGRGRPLGTDDCASEEGSAGPGVPCGARGGRGVRSSGGRRGRQGGRTARGLVSRTSRPYFVSSGWGLYYVSASNKVETRKPL